MKSILFTVAVLLVSIATTAQERENQQPKQKEEKTSSSSEKKAGDISQHERIIWAGTGIDLNEKSKDVKNMPNAVSAAFREYFPNQEIDNVRKYRGLYAITYSNPVYTSTHIYKANGSFVEARTVATESELPATIKEKIKAKAGYNMADAVLIENANKEKFYRVHLNKGTDNEFLVYNSQGEQVLYDY